MAIVGYLVFRGIQFYKKNIKGGKGFNLGGDMFGFGKTNLK